jgi:nitroimidazol reductase NimA-like FMN-containing flavoprotein (pyridoxamine 5'-phosphate oxidase superfamily)
MAARLVALDELECRRRLAKGGLGRTGVCVGALPAIFPVNYAVLDGDIVFRTGPGTKLDAAVAGVVVAFEVDHFDPLSHTGWSVMVVGVARRITDPDERARAEHLPLASWAEGARDAFVRLESSRVTGRELTLDGLR